MRTAPAYPAAALRVVIDESEARYPAECCGLVFRSDRTFRVEPLPNVLDAYHARDPRRFPRTARTGYLIDPKVQLGALEAAEQRGEELCAIFHSHADTGAYFSDEDRALSLADDGEPILPGVEYLVASVRAGRCDDLRGFLFEAGGEARERSVALPPAPARVPGGDR